MRCVLVALIMTLGAFPKWARPVRLATGLFNAESSEVRRARREKSELKYGLRPAAAAFHPSRRALRLSADFALNWPATHAHQPREAIPAPSMPDSQRLPNRSSFDSVRALTDQPSSGV
jgi:hypothetical protein